MHDGSEPYNVGDLLVFDVAEDIRDFKLPAQHRAIAVCHIFPAVPWAALRTVHAASVTPPKLEQGIQIGDVRAHRAVIWSRSDRPARLLVEYDVSEHFVNPTRVRGPFALGTTDFTARVDLTHLPDGR